MARKKKEEKVLGTTRRRIEDEISKLEQFTGHFSMIQDKFEKAIASSMRTVKLEQVYRIYSDGVSGVETNLLFRYAAEDFIKEGDAMEKSNEICYLG